MLLRFTVDNFRSFGEEMTLDLSASGGLKDNPGKGVTDLGISIGKYLNSVAIYGANSSGKSNLLMALGTMRMMVIGSVRLNDNDELPYEPYLLSTEETRPTRFEVVFYEPENRSTITYGFEYNDTSILKEWLNAKIPRKSSKKWLLRIGQQVTIDNENYLNDIDPSSIRKVNSNRLYVSLAGQVGNDLSNRIIKWFDEDLRVISGIEDTYSRYTRRRVYDSEELKSDVQKFLGKMKLGFEQFIPRKIDFEKIGFPQGLPQEIITQLKKEPIIRISTVHNVYDKEGTITNSISLDLESQESAGTNKIFNLSGPILESLANGHTLVIDELDSQMHPLISCRLVAMFNNPEENPKAAQLIFTTHDTNLLSRDVFRRDQVWFTEKDPTEKTTLYPLLKAKEMNSALKHAPRIDSNYQKNYIHGMYGAIPYLTSEVPLE